MFAMKSKGFTLAQFQTIALGFVLTAVVVSMGAYILNEMATTEQDNPSSTTAITNESLNFAVNNTWYTLGHRPMATLTAVYNDSAHTATYDSSLFNTQHSTSGAAQIRMLANSSLGVAPNVTVGTRYVAYTYGSERYYNLTHKGLESLETFGDWLPLVAIAVVAAICIGVIIVYFQRKGYRT